MNYLAHIFLSFDDDDILIGNFIADFIRNKDVKQLNKGQMNGVLLHRLIDAFTDIHPVVRKTTKRLRPVQGKYAPVVSDIIFDYFLAKNWSRYSQVPLSEFSENTYRRLLSNTENIPDKTRIKIEKMCAGNFIDSYLSLDNLLYVFQRMDVRTTFPSRFTEAISQVREDEEKYDRDFQLFFPELMHKAKSFITGLDMVEEGDPPADEKS